MATRLEDEVYEKLVRASKGHLTSVTVEGQRWVHVPRGSVIMPRELTENMCLAACRATERSTLTLDDLRAIYRAMIGARPTIPT